MNHLLGFRFELGFPLLCGIAMLLGSYKISAQNQTTTISAQNETTTISAQNDTQCKLIGLNKTIPTTVREIIDQSISNAKNFDGDAMLFLTYFIKYNLTFPERKLKAKAKTPLDTNLQNVYNRNNIFRVLNRHGSTLMDLAFNYDVVSIMTLTIGTRALEVPVAERPDRCLDGLSENDTLDVVLYLLGRDFNETSVNDTLGNDDKICVHYIENNKGRAKFKARCYLSDSTEGLEKKVSVMNGWLYTLYIVLAIIRLALLLYGPLLLTSYAASLSNQSVPYAVKLKEPLYRSMFIAKSLTDFARVRGRRILDLSKCRGFPKLKESMLTCPMGVPFMAEILEYDILAATKRLIKENEVPVTVWSSLEEAIFGCKMKNTAGISECCYTDMFKSMSCVKKKVIWLSCCYKVGILLLVFCIPWLYYVRLIVFYFCERTELSARVEAARKLNLTMEFENNLLLHFRPTHPLFITIYAIYFVSAICLAFLTERDHEDRFRNIVVGSFQDLDRLSYLKVMKMAAENILWPFRRFGYMGVFVALVYWVVFIPWTLIVYLGYFLPTVYLFVRMMFYSRKAFLQTIRTRSGIRKYQANAKFDESIDVFKTEFLLGDDKNAKPEEPRSSGPRMTGPQEADEMEKFRVAAKKDEDKDSVASSIIHTLRIKPGRLAIHVLSSVVCVITLISLLIIVSECVGALAELAVFTMMGVIVKSGVTVRYAIIFLLVVFYSYGCFSSVRVKYLALNTFLFPELKSRVEDLFNVTALPSHLQENEAFKSQKLSQQAAHEYSDDIAEMPARHWLINDLVLFVDNQDTFRIPRRLFKAVCEIQVAGVPGPVHMGILESFISFMKMAMFLTFVVIAVQCFGSIVEISSSIQTMAIAGSGIIPLCMSIILNSSEHEVEVNSLSFTSKLDEVIKNFWQLWPIHDFTFRVATKTALPEPLTQKQIFQKDTPEKQLPEDLTQKQITQKETPAKQVGRNTVDARPTMKIESEVGTGRKSKAQPVPENENMHNAAYKPRLILQINRTNKANAVMATAANAVSRKLKPSPNVPFAGQDTQNNTLEAEAPQPATINTIDLIINKQKPTMELVDILIRVPAKYEDLWIDGWSNIVDYRDVKKEKRESDITNTMLQAAAQSREERSNKTHKKGEDLTDTST